MIKTYYLLTKPGILLGNLITTVGGFALASKGIINPWLFLATLVGLGLSIASACVFNNYLDQDSDRKMVRTRNRPLVRKLISGTNALIFATILGVIGFSVLALYTNLLTVFITFVGFFIYVVLYYVCKHKTVYGTLIGSISGAVPPVIGYTAVSDRFDIGAMMLFCIMFLWQMPHFFAIAIYLFDDYTAAGIPVLPVKKGIYITKINMLLYLLAFIVAALMPTVLGFTGYPYLAVVALVSLIWLSLCIAGFRSSNDRVWARSMFRFSLVVIMVFSIMISINGVSGRGVKGHELAAISKTYE